jgi:hypothetical protein
MTTDSAPDLPDRRSPDSPNPQRVPRDDSAELSAATPETSDTLSAPPDEAAGPTAETEGEKPSEAASETQDAEASSDSGPVASGTEPPAREAIEEHGMIFEDRFGQPITRPQVAIERDSRLAFARLITQLGLRDMPCATAENPLKDFGVMG